MMTLLLGFSSLNLPLIEHLVSLLHAPTQAPTVVNRRLHLSTTHPSPAPKVNECNGDVTPIEKIAYHSAARRYFLVVDDTSTFSGVVGRRQIT
jgi:hypothetical protein